MHFGLCRYDWHDGAYRPPLGTVGAVDLRRVPEQAIPGVHGSGPVVVCSAIPIPRESLIRAFSGAKAALDYTWRMLTTHSDPLGLDAPKPLMPMTDGHLLLRLGPVSRVQRFRLGSPHANRVLAVLRSDFSQMWEETNGDDHCRRVLDMTCETRRHDGWRLFVPRRLWRHVQGRLLHATTYTDDFNRADSGTLGANWVQWGGTSLGIVSNAARSSGEARARYDSSLSGSDNYTQFNDANADIGPLARMSASATSDGTNSSYMGFAETSTLYTFKIVSGSLTNLGSTSGTGAALRRIQANGSTIKHFSGEVEKQSITDTAISSGLAGGFWSGGGTKNWDNFETGDLAAAPSGNPWYYRQQQALCV